MPNSNTIKPKKPFVVEATDAEELTFILHIDDGGTLRLAAADLSPAQTEYLLQRSHSYEPYN